MNLPDSSCPIRDEPKGVRRWIFVLSFSSGGFLPRNRQIEHSEQVEPSATELNWQWPDWRRTFWMTVAQLGMSPREPEMDVDVVILEGESLLGHAIFGLWKEELVGWPNEGRRAGSTVPMKDVGK